MIIEADQLVREYVAYDGSGLRRTRRIVRAVDGLTLRVERGEAVGYIGANGSGKSTTIKMIAGILTPTSGRVRTCGLRPVPDRRALARKIGVVFGQRSALWWDLPLAESFPILAAMHRIPGAEWRRRFDLLVDELELAAFLQRPVRNLSLGQRMRGEVAAALLHSPALAVLDEPTIGLDMISKENLRRFLIRERAERGTTLLLTTHDMGDVQRLCDRMVVIDSGRVAFDGTESELAAATDAERILIVDLATPVDVASLRLPDHARVGAVEGDGTQLSIAFAPRYLSAAHVLAAVQGQAEVIELSLAEPAIEDLVRRIYTRGGR
ncbi:MAG: ATP-binding cassette domain-containing protein [Propioniciclava sp.]|uniref:ABC transporter ATP-binding protein n=1 Tax=Propioniciclava sp. TaxID=2038686 RepID=UPI0039E28A08